MPYAVQADLEAQSSKQSLVMLADEDGDLAPDASVVSEAIANADAEIDSYLGVRYTVPISPTPELVNKLSIDIALWNLYSRRGIENTLRRDRYKDAIARLVDLAEGKAVLPGTTGVVAELSGDSPKSSEVEEDRLFTRGRESKASVGTLDSF